MTRLRRRLRQLRARLRLWQVRTGSRLLTRLGAPGDEYQGALHLLITGLLVIVLFQMGLLLLAGSR